MNALVSGLRFSAMTATSDEFPVSDRRDGLADYLRSHPHPGGIVVSERSRFIYMKAPRTGGTSILRGVLERTSCDVFHFKDHRPRFERWLAALTDEDLRDYRFFTFVRNPWDRAVSIASYFNLDFRRFAMEFNRMTSTNLVLRQHALPLHMYTHIDGRSFVDFVGRFERLQADFDELMELIGLSRTPLPHLSNSHHDDYRSCYDSDLRTRVEELYGRDAVLFGYTFDG
jgi:hypothetical protein